MRNHHPETKSAIPANKGGCKAGKGGSNMPLLGSFVRSGFYRSIRLVELDLWLNDVHGPACDPAGDPLGWEYYCRAKPLHQDCRRHLRNYREHGAADEI